MSFSEPSPYKRYRALVDAIESDCRVADWRSGDVDLWPIASQDLFLEIFRTAGRDTAPRQPPMVARAASSLATPVVNVWRSRRDIRNWVARPYKADAIFLGDGVSLDFVHRTWRDRFGEPVAAAFEEQGRTSFVMQSGNLTRLPWARPTYAANQIAAAAAVAAAWDRIPAADLPDHERVMRLVSEMGVVATSLAAQQVARRARIVDAQSVAFERILRRVCPRAAFVTTYYAGLGHAFALACRRRGVLCVDLQHCAIDDAHRGYRWRRVPPRGYSTLPGLFWSWTEEDAANLRNWADGRWHTAIAGGHTQIGDLRDGEGELLWRDAAVSVADGRSYNREILVALQPIGGKEQIWEALADQIERSPDSWRWWLRRHPSSTAAQDHAYGRLWSVRRAGVVRGAAAQIPLPALLRHMDAVISLASGAAGEAALLGIPAFFLDEEALATFPRLLARGQARLVGVGLLIAAIRRLSGRPSTAVQRAPPIHATLDEIGRRAADYAQLCRETAENEVDCAEGVIGKRQPPRAA